jgi:hypothetical protein
MKIEHGHFFQQTEQNSINISDQSQSIQTPDSQNNPVDSLETHDGSDVFLGADDVFLLQTMGGDALKQSAEDFRSGNVTIDSTDGFQLQDAMKPRLHSSGADLPQQFTDYISSLQKAVNDALDGDAAAFEKVEAAFGLIPEEENLPKGNSFSNGSEVAAQQNTGGSAAPDKFDIGIDPGDRLPDLDPKEDDDPDIPDDGSSEPGDSPEQTDTHDGDIGMIAAGDASDYPDLTGMSDDTEPHAGHDAAAEPDHGAAGAPSSDPSGNDEDDDLDDLEIERYIDPDSIGTDPTTLNETGMRFLVYGSGVKDGVRPDMDQSAPEMSPEQLPGFGVIDTTPEVDDYSSAIGTVRTFGPGGDPVNPDNPIEAPSGTPPTTDDYSHKE